MPVIDSAVVLPRMVFIAVWDVENVGEPHPVIGPDNHYMTDEFRAELHRRAYAYLEGLGLAVAGRSSPEFRHTLRVIARSDRQFYGWSSATEEQDNGVVLVAALGRDAIRVSADDELVLLDPVPPTGLAEHLLAALPDVPAADVAPTTVPRAHLGNPSGFSNANPLAQLVDTGPFDYLTEVMGAQRDALHQLYAAVRDKSGERRRSRPLSAIDLTERGRVLAYLDDHPRHGREQVTLLPGTPANLTTVLTNLATASGRP